MSRPRIIAGKAVIVVEAQNRVEQTFRKIRTNLHRMSNSLQSVGSNLGQKGILGSIASGLLFRQYAKFDDLMLELQVKLGFLDKMGTKQEMVMGRLEKRIRSLGRSTSFTSQQIASAAVELAKGSLSPREIENSLRAVLDLARGTKAALDDAGRLFVRTMRTFNLNSTQATEVVSQFVRATRFGTLNIEDLELALRYSSGTAATLEQNLAPILAIFAELSNKGLAGSIGGTSLNTAMANLVKKMQDLAAAYPGFRAIYRDGSLDLLGTFRELFKITSKLSAVEQIQVFQDVFNLRGARAVAGIRDIQNIIKMADSISMAGDEARKASQIMDSGLGGKGRIALSAIQDLILGIGEASQRYLIPFLNIIRSLVNELNRLVQINPELTALIAFSPAILLASGAAFLTLGKALRLVASSMTALLAVGAPVTRMLAGLTATQLAGIVKAPKNLAKAGVAYKGSGFSFNKGIGAAAGNARAAGMAAKVSKAHAAGQTALAASLRKRYQYEMLLSKIIAKRGVGDPTQAAKNAKVLKTQMKTAEMRARLAKGARTTARFSMFGNIGKAGGLAAKSTLGATAKGLTNIATSTLRVANVFRRFAFSATGVLTIIEVLLTFTSLGPRIMSGIGNGFKAIFDIIKLGQGPFKLFMVSLQALAKGETGIGLQGLKTAFMDIVSIIGNQLVAAWNKFVQAMGPFYDAIRNTITAIVVSIEAVFEALRLSLGRVFQGIQGQISLISDGFGGSGNIVGDIGSFIAKLIPTLVHWIARFAILLTDFADKFAIKAEAAIGRALSPFLGGNLTGRTDLINKQEQSSLTLAAAQTDLALRRLNKGLEKQLTTIDRTFNRSASEEGGVNAIAARRRSAAAANNSARTAAMIGKIISQGVSKALTNPPPGAGARGAATPVSLLNEAKQTSRLAASALVGSAQATRRNAIKVGETVEKKQLEVLTDIRDGQDKIIKDKGLSLK